MLTRHPGAKVQDLPRELHCAVVVTSLFKKYGPLRASNKADRKVRDISKRELPPVSRKRPNRVQPANYVCISIGRSLVLTARLEP